AGAAPCIRAQRGDFGGETRRIHAQRQAQATTNQALLVQHGLSGQIQHAVSLPPTADARLSAMRLARLAAVASARVPGPRAATQHAATTQDPPRRPARRGDSQEDDAVLQVEAHQTSAFATW